MAEQKDREPLFLPSQVLRSLELAASWPAFGELVPRWSPTEHSSQRTSRAGPAESREGEGEGEGEGGGRRGGGRKEGGGEEEGGRGGGRRKEGGGGREEEGEETEGGYYVKAKTSF